MTGVPEVVPLPEPIEPTPVQPEQGGSRAEMIPPTLKTFDELRTLAPELHKAILQGMFQMFRSQQERANQRIRKTLKEGQQK